MQRCVLMILFAFCLLLETCSACHYSYNASFLKTCEFCFKFISEHGITGGINRKLATAKASANAYLHPTTTRKPIVYERRANGSTAKSEAKPLQKTETKTTITRENWHLASLADRLQIQRNFINKQITDKKWGDPVHKIGGREAYADLTKKNIYYTKDGRHGDIEMWRVSGKIAYHEGSIEPIDGASYRKPNHKPQRFE